MKGLGADLDSETRSERLIARLPARRALQRYGSVLAISEVRTRSAGRTRAPRRTSRAILRRTTRCSSTPHSRTRQLAKSLEASRLGVITRRRILYWLGAMIAVLVVGTIIGLIWADTSNVAGSIAVATNIIGLVGIVFLLVALVVVTRRQRRAGRTAS
jgi:hypothetical protein